MGFGSATGLTARNTDVSVPEGLIADEQFDVIAGAPDHAAATRVDQVLVMEDGAAPAAADEDAARHGGDATDRLLAVAVVELVAAP